MMSTAAPPANPASQHGARLRVLLVDDEPALLSLGRQALEPLGYHIETAPHGEAAWRRLEAQPADFDLLITDNLMPGLTGLDLLLRLRHAGLSLPVVVSSGSGASPIEARLMARNRAEFVAKPFDLSMFRHAIQRAINLA